MIDIEKLADEILEKIHPYDNWVGSVNDLELFAESYAAKVLEEKEREIAELKTTVRSDNSKVIAALNAHINDLREAFRKIRSCYGDGYEVDNIARQALSKTPAQSLQEHENEVIERCAKVCDEAGQPNKDEIHTDAQWAAKVLAANIRALKDQL